MVIKMLYICKRHQFLCPLAAHYKWWQFVVAAVYDMSCSDINPRVCCAAGSAVSSQAVQPSITCCHSTSPSVHKYHSQFTACRHFTTWHSACSETGCTAVCVLFNLLHGNSWSLL